MIAHVVFFEPKPTATTAQKRSFAQLLGRIGQEIPSIKRAFIGRAVDVDPGYVRSLGEKTYKFAAVLEFDDEAGLVEYLTNPIHSELGALFWEACERTSIVEVETRALDDDLGDFLV